MLVDWVRCTTAHPWFVGLHHQVLHGVCVPYSSHLEQLQQEVMGAGRYLLHSARRCCAVHDSTTLLMAVLLLVVWRTAYRLPPGRCSSAARGENTFSSLNSCSAFWTNGSLSGLIRMWVSSRSRSRNLSLYPRQAHVSGYHRGWYAL